MRLSGPPETHNRHRVAFNEQVKEVIRVADIVLFVLDARNPEETRNHALEEEISAAGKYLVHVLNKADLITISAFPSATLASLSYPVFVSYKSKVGLMKLRMRLKILAQKSRKKRGYEHVHVGIIGYPNVGKSSIVNFLTHRKLAPASQQTGLTRGTQYARLGKDLMLIDSPGVLGTEESNPYQRANTSKLALTAASSVDKIKDPALVVHHLLHDHQQAMERYYQTESGGDAEVFLEALGQRWKILKKGGLIDEDKVARKIISEWQAGKIKS